MEHAESYEELVAEEDQLIGKINLCEGCQWAILECLSGNCDSDRELGEEILAAVHTIEQDLRTELMHLRLEKGMAAGRLKKMNSGK